MNNYISILGMTRPATCTCSGSRMATGSSSGKRTRVVLSIDDKVGIIGKIDGGSSLTTIAEKFGIAKSIPCLTSKVKILAFSYPLIRTPPPPPPVQRGSDKRGCTVVLITLRSYVLRTLTFFCNMLSTCCKSYVTVSEKTDHLAQISDIEIVVLRCSALFTLRNGEVRIVIEYTVVE